MLPHYYRTRNSPGRFIPLLSRLTAFSGHPERLANRKPEVMPFGHLLLLARPLLRRAHL